MIYRDDGFVRELGQLGSGVRTDEEWADKARANGWGDCVNFLESFLDGHASCVWIIEESSFVKRKPDNRKNALCVLASGEVGKNATELGVHCGLTRDNICTYGR